MSEWVSTLVVSLPSTRPASPLRPCEAMTIASQPRSRAVLMIASQGADEVTVAVSQATLDPEASSLILPSISAACARVARSYSSSVIA